MLDFLQYLFSYHVMIFIGLIFQTKSVGDFLALYVLLWTFTTLTLSALYLFDIQFDIRYFRL